MGGGLISDVLSLSEMDRKDCSALSTFVNVLGRGRDTGDCLAGGFRQLSGWTRAARAHLDATFKGLWGDSRTADVIRGFPKNKM